MQVTIIVPTYNEAENLPKLVSALFALPLENLNVLVVDDNSPDGTGRIADELAAQHPGRILVTHRAGKLGLRTAYLEGFRRAIAEGAEVVGQMDADFSHDPAKLVEMVAALQTADVAFGSRYVPGGSVDVDWPLWRKSLSAFGNFYARTILGFPLRDVTTGYRLWRREAILGLKLAGRSGSFIGALNEHALQFSRLSDLPVVLDIAPEVARCTLPAETELQLLRIVQEALTNIRKHAAATQAVIRLRVADRQLELTIRDDGQGFAPDNPPTGATFGLTTMRERAESIGASYQIISEPGAGTALLVQLPLKE